MQWGDWTKNKCNLHFQALELDGVDLANQGSESTPERKAEKAPKLSFQELFAEERS